MTPEPPSTSKPSRDIHALDLSGLDWSEPPESAGTLHQRLVAHAVDAIGWYQRTGRRKAKYAVPLRVIALSAGAMAAAVPFVDPLVEDLEAWATLGEVLGNPALSSILLIVAAACVGVDRFYGASSSYIRFQLTREKLQHVLNGFQFERQRRLAKGDDAFDVDAELVAARDFADAVQGIVYDESAEWAKEFQAQLKDSSAGLPSVGGKASGDRPAEG